MTDIEDLPDVPPAEAALVLLNQAQADELDRLRRRIGVLKDMQERPTRLKRELKEAQRTAVYMERHARQVTAAIHIWLAFKYDRTPRVIEPFYLDANEYAP